MKISHTLKILAVFFTGFLISQPALAGSQPFDTAPRILIINSYSDGYDWSDEELAGIREVLSEALPKFELYVEYLDTKNFYQKELFPFFAELLKKKYQERRLDLVISMDNAALEFSTQYRQDLFPGVPLVFCGINNYQPSLLSGQVQVTGVAEIHDSIATLALALQLQPQIREVVVLHDYTDTGLAMRQELDSAKNQFPSLNFRYLPDAPLENSIKLLEELSNEQIVLLLSYAAVKMGRTFSQAEIGKLISANCPVPVYAVHAEQLGKGIIGGMLLEGRDQGRRASQLALRILRGEKPATLPVVTTNLSRAMFDNQVLEKFHIDPARLPDNTVLINLPQTFYSVNKKTFWLLLGIIAFLTFSLLVLYRNNRQRKLAEEDLRQSEERFRLLIEQAPEAILLHDIEHEKFIGCNAKAAQLFGCTREGIQKLGPYRFYTADQPDGKPLEISIQEHVDRALTGEEVRFERVIENANKKRFICEVCLIKLPSKNQKLLRISYVDISERKKAERDLKLINEKLENKVLERTLDLEEQIKHREVAEKTLRKSERHYRQLIENITDIVTIVGADGHILYATPSVQKVLGFSPEQLIGRNVRDFVHESDLLQVDIKTLHERFNDRSPVEYRITSASGEYRYLESHIQKFEQEDGSESYLFNSRDITLRKQSEEEIRKLSMVVEQNPSSVVITDTKGNIEYVNPAFEKITGYRANEVLGQNPRILSSGKTSQKLFEELWLSINSGNIWHGEFINKKKNGEIYNENVLVLPIKNLRDEITHFVAVKENITELIRERQRAEDANRAKSEFLSKMSHELRTPLNAVNGFSQLMLNSTKNPLNEKQRKMTEQINAAGKHLLELINDVLDLARIESGHVSLSRETVDPDSVLNDCLMLMRPMAKKQNIMIEWLEVGDRLPFVWADHLRLKQVLLNLLSNAVKYNRPGGKVLIQVIAEDNSTLRFEVKDTGIGIAEEKQPHIFQPFARVLENAEEIEGTGIGMTISKQLVEIMDGKIGFESVLGQGSTFWFSLPMAGSDSPQASTHPTHAQTSRRKLPSLMTSPNQKVLYIEDNLLNIEYMADLFAEHTRMQLTTRLDPEDGIRVAASECPQLILLDLNLPKMDGFEVFRELKSNPVTAGIPVIAVSADATKKTIQKAANCGFVDYLQKPFDTDDLKGKLSKVLGQEL